MRDIKFLFFEEYKTFEEVSVICGKSRTWLGYYYGGENWYIKCDQYWRENSVREIYLHDNPKYRVMTKDFLKSRKMSRFRLRNLAHFVKFNGNRATTRFLYSYLRGVKIVWR